MKIFEAVYHPQREYFVLTTNDGILYLDGAMGHKDSGEREAGKKRSGEVAPPPPISDEVLDDIERNGPKWNAPAKVPVVRIDDKTKICPLCDGRKTPKTIPSLKERCTFCGETGVVMVCRHCGGIRRIGIKCFVCDGKGLKVCPDCQGIGEQLIGVICKRCSGAGHLTSHGNTLK